MSARRDQIAEIARRLAGLGDELPPRLQSGDVRRLEAAMGCALPAELKRHVLEVADGGPGPNGGLWTLERGLSVLSAVSDASRRFPLAARVVDELIAEKQTDDSVVHYDESDPPPLRGIIPIADEGDGLMVAVVARGKRAGQLWLVGEAWTPLLDEEGLPLTFSAWWLGWLGERESRKTSTKKAPAATPKASKASKANKASTPGAQSAPMNVDPSWPKTLKRALKKPGEIRKLAISSDHDEWDAASLPDVFEVFDALTQLDISNSYRLSSLPPSLGRLARLQKVWLTSLPALQSVEVVMSYPELEFLNVSRCRALRALPPRLGELSELRELLAMFTGLRTLPESLASAPKLRKLWLHLSMELDMRSAWPIIARMPALTELSLAEGRFASWPQGPLPRPPALVKLDLTRAELPEAVLEQMRAWAGVALSI